MKKIFQIVAILILIVLPFLPITENVLAPALQVDNKSFGMYIGISIVIIVVGILLILFLIKKQTTLAWLLLSIGLFAMIPLHLGAPRMGADLLTSSGIEQFRYGILLLATVLLLIAGIKIILPIKSVQSGAFLIILIVAFGVNFWDSYSSFMLGSEFKNWIETGKNEAEFFAQYDFQIFWRAMARILLYITAMALTFVLMQQARIRLWQYVILNVFSLTGIVFCILCLNTQFAAYYFPFMIPAVALAPIYWTGIALATNKQEI